MNSDWQCTKGTNVIGKPWWCVFRLQRLVKDLFKQLQGQDSGQWASNKVSGLDRTLGEIDLSHFRETGKEDYKQLANLNIINLNIYQARWYCFFGVEEIAIVHRSALWHVSSVMSCLAVSIRLALLPAWHIGYSTATCLWLLVNEEQIKCVFIEHMVSILKLPSTRASIVSCYVACIT